MTYVLVLDTETTGLYNNVALADHPSQPHLVQLACLLLTDTGGLVSSVDLIIKPEGRYAIPKAAAQLHGITTEVAEMAGVPLRVAVACFTNLRAQAGRLVGHNLPFDRNVMATAILRTGSKPAHPGPSDWSCTRQMAALSGRFRKHDLTTVYQGLFGEPFEGAHTAFADAQACARVYFELKQREPPAVTTAVTDQPTHQEEPPF